jgi:hypothetical protein
MIVAGLTVDESFKYSVMNTCLGFIGVNVGIYAMRHLAGRRTILMTGAVLQGLCMLAMAISSSVAAGTTAANNCLIAFFALYLFSYNAFVGDASYPTSTELVSTRLRSWSVGSAISLGYFLAWLTGFCSPYFINPGQLNWVSVLSRTKPLFFVTRILRLTIFFSRGPNMGIFGQDLTLPVLSSSTFSFRRRKAEHWRKSTSYL